MSTELPRIPDQVLVNIEDLTVVLEAKGPWMADTDDYESLKRLEAATKALSPPEDGE